MIYHFVSDDPDAGKKFGQTWGCATFEKWIDGSFSTLTLKYYDGPPLRRESLSEFDLAVAQKAAKFIMNDLRGMCSKIGKEVYDTGIPADVFGLLMRCEVAGKFTRKETRLLCEDLLGIVKPEKGKKGSKN